MKYIVFQKADSPMPLPVLFPAPATHADVARIFAGAGYRPVSAGYIEAQFGAALARSDSLNLDRGPMDDRLIAALGRTTLSLLSPEERCAARHDTSVSPCLRGQSMPLATRL